MLHFHPIDVPIGEENQETLYLREALLLTKFALGCILKKHPNLLQECAAEFNLDLEGLVGPPPSNSIN